MFNLATKIKKKTKDKRLKTKDFFTALKFIVQGSEFIVNS